jgi:hypothetical protein
MAATAAQVTQDHEPLGGDALASAAQQFDQVALVDRRIEIVSRPAGYIDGPLGETDR